MPKKSEAVVQCPLCHFLGWAKDSEAARHLKNARREMLLAFKSAIEAGLSALEAEEKLAAKPKARKVKIS